MRSLRTDTRNNESSDLAYNILAVVNIIHTRTHTLMHTHTHTQNSDCAYYNHCKRNDLKSCDQSTESSVSGLHGIPDTNGRWSAASSVYRLHSTQHRWVVLRRHTGRFWYPFTNSRVLPTDGSGKYLPKREKNVAGEVRATATTGRASRHATAVRTRASRAATKCCRLSSSFTILGTNSDV